MTASIPKQWGHTYIATSKIRMVLDPERGDRAQARAFRHLTTDQPGAGPWPAKLKTSLRRAERQWGRPQMPTFVVWPNGFEDGALIFDRPTPHGWTFLLTHEDRNPSILDGPPPLGFPGRFRGWLDLSVPRKARLRRSGRWHIGQDSFGAVWQRYRLTNWRDGTVYRQFILAYRPGPNDKATWDVFPGSFEQRRSLAIHTDLRQDE